MAKPLQPVTSKDYNLNVTAGTVDVTWTGNQPDPTKPNYWEVVDVDLYRESGWDITYGLSNTKTSHTFTGLNPDFRYGFLIRGRNSTDGEGEWSEWLDIYTKPTAPTLTTAIVNASDSSKVDLAWEVTAAYPGDTHILRKAVSESTYSDIATLKDYIKTYRDTITSGGGYSYKLVTYVPNNKLTSDDSNVITIAPSSAVKLIPGVKSMYLGSSSITRVMFQNKEIWKT